MKRRSHPRTGLPIPARKRRPAVLAVGAILLAGCADVPYYAKEDLGRRIMQMDTHDLESAFLNKILASREVSGGLPGNSAGGGCGCGN
jgi:hypothetical protein